MPTATGTLLFKEKSAQPLEVKLGSTAKSELNFIGRIKKYL
jgi:hypothetical protein